MKRDVGDDDSYARHLMASILSSPKLFLQLLGPGCSPPGPPLPAPGPQPPGAEVPLEGWQGREGGGGAVALEAGEGLALVWGWVQLTARPGEWRVNCRVTQHKCIPFHCL